MNHSDYIQAILATVDVALIRSKNFKILFDPANGSAVEVGKKLFGRLGDLVMINDQIGQEPPRPSEPRRETLTETAKQVVKHGCDLGIATDIDADRVLFIDETGVVLSEDLTAVILAQDKKILVTPINSSGLFIGEAKKWGGRVIDCPVGPPEIIAAIKKQRADFAYEESGKYFFPPEFLWADGLLAGVKMLAAMARAGKKLSQIRRQYPEYFQVKLAVKCLFTEMPEKFKHDGVKFVLGDSWLMIRASGTEPLIRIFTDSPNQKLAEELAEKGKKMVEKVLCGQ